MQADFFFLFNRNLFYLTEPKNYVVFFSPILWPHFSYNWIAGEWLSLFLLSLRNLSAQNNVAPFFGLENKMFVLNSGLLESR